MLEMGNVVQEVKRGFFFSCDAVLPGLTNTDIDNGKQTGHDETEHMLWVNYLRVT